jgi:RimJ/RimL family protein N-acetyltransferase
MIDIVPMADAYIDKFYQCLDIVARERAYLAQLQAPPLDQLRAFVRECIANGVPQFVALDEGRVIGWCDIFPARAQAVSHRGSLGMGVLPTHRSRGIGAQLVQVCLAAARTRGLTRVELEVRADNERALRLYRRLGFRQEGVKRRGIRIDGVYYDSVEMGLLLA